MSSYKRSGQQPYGASFAFNVATELPIVIDNRETDWTAGIEWASHQGMFHVDYQHQKFDQNVPSFTFDNPQFATDFCRYGNATNPPGVCYDPSGYSNGNGPATGRMSLPPSSSVDQINWMGMVKLPARTTANASFTMGASAAGRGSDPLDDQLLDQRRRRPTRRSRRCSTCRATRRRCTSTTPPAR